jgi:hypothetical protein
MTSVRDLGDHKCTSSKRKERTVEEEVRGVSGTEDGELWGCCLNPERLGFCCELFGSPSSSGNFLLFILSPTQD